jgi:predicted nucleic acid-binding protein
VIVVADAGPLIYLSAVGQLDLLRERCDPAFQLLATVLDVGEAAAIALARREQADLVLIDERRGRLTAQRLGMVVQGTLGVLVRAKRAGSIEQVAPLLRSLVDAGFWISDDVIRRVLAAVGEAMSLDDD